MNDPEEILGRLTPRGPSDSATAAVRGAMADALANSAGAPLPKQPRTSRWERRIAWLTAAALLVGVTANVVVARMDDARRQRWLSLTPAPAAARDLAKLVESISDAETGAWALRQLAPERTPSPTPVASPAAFEQYISIILREMDHVSAQKDVEVHRPGGGHPDRRGADRQRDLRPDNRHVA